MFAAWHRQLTFWNVEANEALNFYASVLYLFVEEFDWPVRAGKHHKRSKQSRFGGGQLETAKL